MTRCVRLLLLVSLCLATVSVHAIPEERTARGAVPNDTVVVDLQPGQSIRPARLDDPAAVQVDGHLDEAVWSRLAAYDEFVVIDPDTLGETRHATRIRLAYDARGLYVAAELHQPPATRIKRLTARDGYGNRDSINITLDTSGDGRYGFWFGLNLGDALTDGTVLPERNFSRDWDGPWYGRTQETAYGWSAELLIPWSTVSMPSTGEVRRMGLYMSRKVAYLDERWGWPGLPSTQPRFLSVLQPIEMREVAPRQQYNLYPFVAASYDGIADSEDLQTGADLFWRPSSNFQLTATVNPDFGSADTDEVDVNLSATETFFPEQRLFFLEGREIFFATPRADPRGTIGGSWTTYTMVNTRRIGGQPDVPALPAGLTLPDRERVRPTELDGALKTTGQLGRLRYGVLGAVERDPDLVALTEEGEPVRLDAVGNDYGIARLLYEDNPRGAYAAFGVLTTAVTSSARDAYVTGIDGHWLTPDGRLKVDGQVMTSETDADGRGYGGFVDFEYSYGQGRVQRLGVEWFDERFDMNDLGFLRRNDHYRVRSSFLLTQSDVSWARKHQLDVRGFFERNLSENRLVGARIAVADRVTFDDFSEVTARLSLWPEHYEDLDSRGNGTFRIEDRLRVRLGWESDDTRPVAVGFGGSWRNERLGGESWAVEAELDWRPTDRFNLSLDLSWRDRGGWLLHQEDDLFATFDAKQVQPELALDYFLSARQQFRVAFQWVGIRAREEAFYRVPVRPDDLVPIARPASLGAPGSADFAVSQYSFQTRYRWEIAPLSDLSMVYTRQADLSAALGEEDFSDLLGQSWREPLSDLLLVKIRYRLGS